MIEYPRFLMIDNTASSGGASPPAAPQHAPSDTRTTRVSVDSAGREGDGGSGQSAVSTDGRFVAFASNATNLVAADTNAGTDVFVHDRTTGQTTRVSVDSAGVQGDWGSGSPAVSADGRLVAFDSWSNLVSGDSNAQQDVFVHDRTTGQTTRVSVDSAGAQGNEWSRSPAISADGRCVAFVSKSTNLVPADTNSRIDTFVHDRTTGQTTRVSVDSAGNQWNHDSDWYGGLAISRDGRLVGLSSGGAVYVHDRATGQTELVSVDSGGAKGNGTSYAPAISADGGVVVFWSLATNLVPGDTNGAFDVFAHDRATGLTTRVSVASGGAQANHASLVPSVSANGRFVAFTSQATNLVPDDTNGVADVFVHDRTTCQTTRVSVDPVGAPGNDASVWGALSADGRFIASESSASNLIDGDSNLAVDIFVRDLCPTITTTDTARPGATVNLALEAPNSPDQLYLCACALGTEPGFPFLGHVIPLNPDSFFQFSLAAPGMFQNFVGRLDASGRANARIVFPITPWLDYTGLVFYTAFFTLEFSPLDIGSVSCPLQVVVVR